MQIFFSWSKSSSRQVASVLEKYIHIFFRSRSLETFVSQSKIEPGDKWNEIIAEAIRESELCIIVFTTENEFSRWLHFESGAIAFNTKSANIIPFLFQGAALDSDSPLRAYQYVSADKDGIERLFRVIKKTFHLRRVTEEDFSKRFDAVFPDIERELASIAAQPTRSEIMIPFSKIFPADVNSATPSKVFFGAPMASLPEIYDYELQQKQVESIIDAIEICCHDRQVYWAGRDIKSKDKFDGGRIALGKDLGNLKSSSFCVFVLLEPLVTSVLVEIGYAIALNKKTVIFCRKRADLPFLLRYADYEIDILKIYECSSHEEIIKNIEHDGAAILR